MNKFIIQSQYAPTGDQPEAISALVEGVIRGEKAQVLLGVTGSGKTFTIANVIAQVNLPTLILSPNKTLAAQLYGEMRAFFPSSAVEYYVSYYDYYQPEAYIPSTDTYIEKDLNINDEIDKLRLRAVSSLLSGRKDVIVVSSVSCIYGLGSPVSLTENVSSVKKRNRDGREALLRSLVAALYVRDDMTLRRGCFRVRGDTVDIFPAYSEKVVRVTYWGNEVDSIEEMDAEGIHSIASFDEYKIYPANLFTVSANRSEDALRMIKKDLDEQVNFFIAQGEPEKAQRIKERVEYDIEMIKELGHCSGIENYSRYFDGRVAGERPYCLLDFFPKDFLLVVDESHVSMPQLKAMYGGDHARKTNLVEYGFRLPAAYDNRPLTFDEFANMVKQTIYVSATPADFELKETQGTIIEQIIRPTGIPDPEMEVRASTNQIDDLLEEIICRCERKERTLITTLTKRMAEELAEYLLENKISTAYMHSDVATLDRVRILEDLRKGKYDVLVGVNLLREGLDLPEVSLVAILDADKEGFLRNRRSLIQMAGRAARNINGKVIMYADTITESMKITIEETARRRKKQLEYNQKMKITPTSATTNASTGVLTSQIKNNNEDAKSTLLTGYSMSNLSVFSSDPIIDHMSKEELKKCIDNTFRLMKDAAKRHEFLQAAQYRDEMFRLQKLLELKNE